jgi:hypothetical protein
MTKDELIDLLEASTDIPGDAQVYAFAPESGDLERVTDLVFNEEKNAIEFY